MIHTFPPCEQFRPTLPTTRSEAKDKDFKEPTRGETTAPKLTRSEVIAPPPARKWPMGWIVAAVVNGPKIGYPPRRSGRRPREGRMGRSIPGAINLLLDTYVRGLKRDRCRDGRCGGRQLRKQRIPVRGLKRLSAVQQAMPRSLRKQRIPVRRVLQEAIMGAGLTLWEHLFMRRNQIDMNGY